MPPKRNEYEWPSARLPIASTSKELRDLARINTQRRAWYRKTLDELGAADEIVPRLWLGSPKDVIKPEVSGSAKYLRLDEHTPFETLNRAYRGGQTVHLKGTKKAEGLVIRLVSELFEVSVEDAYAYLKFRRENLASEDVDDLPTVESRGPSPRTSPKTSPKKASPKTSPKKTSPKRASPAKGKIPEEYLERVLTCVDAKTPGKAAQLRPMLETYYLKTKPLILAELSAYVDVRKAANPDDKGVIGYINAIKAIRASNVPLVSVKVAKAIKIKGVGEATIEKIGMILEKGRLPSADERKEHYSKTSASLAKLEVFDMGPTVRKKLIDLGLGSPTKLRAAYQKGLKDLPKLNAVQRYKLDEYDVPPKTITPEEGNQVLEKVAKALGSLGGDDLDGIHLAGDLRRGKAAPEVELLVVGEVTSAQLGSRLAKKGLKILSKGVVCHLAMKVAGVPVVVNVSVTPASMEGFNLHKLTGPSTYHSELVSTLKKSGIIIEQQKAYLYDPITDTKTPKYFRTEEELYEAVGRAYVEPQDRT